MLRLKFVNKGWDRVYQSFVDLSEDSGFEWLSVVDVATHLQNKYRMGLADTMRLMGKLVEQGAVNQESREGISFYRLDGFSHGLEYDD